MKEGLLYLHRINDLPLTAIVSSTFLPTMTPSNMASEVKAGPLSPSSKDQNALSEGLMQIFKPAVEELDDKVLSVRYSNNSSNVMCGRWLFSPVPAANQIKSISSNVVVFTR